MKEIYRRNLGNVDVVVRKTTSGWQLIVGHMVIRNFKTKKAAIRCASGEEWKS